MALFAPLSLADGPAALLTTDVQASPESILASPESYATWQYEFSAADEALLDEIQKGCFQYFWKEVGSRCLPRQGQDQRHGLQHRRRRLPALLVADRRRARLDHARRRPRAGARRAAGSHRPRRQQEVRHLSALPRRADRRPAGLFPHEVSATSCRPARSTTPCCKPAR